jgi:hypothetical protein
MGLKKYEIITVGRDKRVRALRSWQVGDRYVNIGDVGGIVYDENTLSQDGLCWLFRGNFGFPGARIGGDSIVDVDESAIDANGSANVDILGSSVVVGSKVNFTVGAGAVDGMTLTAADFEQGGFNAPIVGNPLTGSDSPSYIRLKKPIFAGGTSVTLKCNVGGYAVKTFALDRDGLLISSPLTKATGAGVTITVPAGQYFSLMMTKDPVTPITPAEATAAQITFTALFDAKLVVIDSRLEINPVTSTGTVSIRSGGLYPITPGAAYPDSVIRNSKVVINGHAAANRTVRLISDFIGCNVTIDATSGDSQGVGIYSNVKNLTFTGAVTASWNVAARSSIQATDCDNFAVSPTIFPGLVAALTANMPFVFQGCNVPNGIFYHHVQIANTYRNIDFALAQADLGKSVPGVAYTLVSSETEGMYRIYNTAANLLGFLVESYDSISSIGLLAATATSYGTTIYKDAYLSGKFDIAGTNVFGNKVRSHPMVRVLNVQPRAVQGTFNEVAFGGVITGVVTNANRVVIPRRFRLNRSGSISINGVPLGVETQILAVDPNDKIVGVSSWAAGDRAIAPYSIYPYAFIQFRKTGDAAITPADLAGVTVTVYNGCKIVNTGATAVNIKGNFRVEDNATLINCSLIGSGYFGGKAVASGLLIEGSAFMKDNAKFTKTAGTNVIRNLRITENGTVNLGDVTWLGVVQVADNAVLSPSAITLTECDIFMSGNASITSSVSIAGVLRMKDNAKVSAGALTTIGDITLCGSYNQTAARSSWTGKRVIDNENAPGYDNNVKTQYDF